MKSALLLFICLSGWLVAGVVGYTFGKKVDLRDDIHQDSINMQQISFFLWDYTQKHNGLLPASLNECLASYGAEPLAGLYELLTPKAQLFSLPGSTPILKAKYPHNPGYEMTMYACGQIVQKPNQTMDSTAKTR